MNTESDYYDEGDAAMGCIGGKNNYHVPKPINGFNDIQIYIKSFDEDAYMEEYMHGYRLGSPNMKFNSQDFYDNPDFLSLLSKEKLIYRIGEPHYNNSIYLVYE